VDVFTGDSSCATAHNITVRLRVAAQNTSTNSAFVLQNARVICGVFRKRLPDLKGVPALAEANVKLSTMEFRFYFLNVRHGEVGLSIFSTGVENDPTQEFTIQGEATSSDFIANARLGDCMERLNV
jgi:hypothetical protein